LLSNLLAVGMIGMLTSRLMFDIQSVTVSRTQLEALVVLFLTLVLTLLSTAIAERPILHITRIKSVVLFIALAIVSILELNSRKRLFEVLGVITALTVIIAVLSALNLFIELPFSHSTGPARSLGPIAFFTPRTLGVKMAYGEYGILAITAFAYVAMTVLRPVALHGEANKRRTTLALGALVAILAGIYIGQSRSTIIAFGAVSAFGLFAGAVHPDARIRAARRSIPAGAILSGIVVALVNVRTIISGFLDANAMSASSRLSQYSFAVELMRERPLQGWGWGYFKLSYGTEFTVHNQWLLIGVSIGVPALLLWVYLFVRLALAMVRLAFSADLQGKALAMVGTAAVVGGTVELALYPGFDDVSAILVGILVGIVSASNMNTTA
jgi:O-antigen ligase